jgi:hypothetical protein
MADGKPGDRDGPGGQSRRFGRRRSYRGRPHRGQGERSDARQENRGFSESENGRRVEDARDAPLCPFCAKPIYDLSTALSSGTDAGEPAHFDCVLDRVAAAETLEAGEKIVYLGSGAFAVVTFKDRDETAFTVKRRIQWEKEGEKKDWRKNLSSRIANL